MKIQFLRYDINLPLAAAVGSHDADARGHVNPEVQSSEQPRQRGAIAEVDIAHLKTSTTENISFLFRYISQ